MLFRVQKSKILNNNRTKRQIQKEIKPYLCDLNSNNRSIYHYKNHAII